MEVKTTQTILVLIWAVISVPLWILNIVYIYVLCCVYYFLIMPIEYIYSVFTGKINHNIGDFVYMHIPLLHDFIVKLKYSFWKF